MEAPEVKKVECYCCERPLEEKEGDWIEIGKDKITSAIERRLVCKKCNHLEKKDG